MDSKAAVLFEPADKDGLTDGESLRIESIEVGSPQGDEVLVEIGAASLCHTDVSIALGRLERPRPLVMGHEGAGIVRDVGDRVDSVAPGDHVVLGRIACGKCEFCRRGRSNLCTARKAATPKGTLRTGAIRFSSDGQPRYHCHGVSSFSQYTVVTEDVAIKITDDLPLERATLLGCGVFTGFGAVTNTAGIEVGSSVAIFGAGGVGLNGIQGAVIGGASTIIAVDPIPEKLMVATELGATHTVNPTDGDTIDQIFEITGDGVDYAFDMVGSPQVAEQVIESIGPVGKAVLVGTESPGKKEVGVDLHDIVLWEKQVVGSFNGSYDLGTAIPKLAELAASGKLQLDPLVTNTRPLQELPQAMADLVSGDEIRQVIVPS